MVGAPVQSLVKELDLIGHIQVLAQANKYSSFKTLMRTHRKELVGIYLCAVELGDVEGRIFFCFPFLRIFIKYQLTTGSIFKLHSEHLCQNFYLTETRKDHWE